MRFLLKISFIVIFLGWGLICLAQQTDPFRWEFNGERRTVRAGELIPLEITFQIPPRHYLYKEKIELKLLDGDRFEMSPLEFSPAMTKRDPFLKKQVEIFEGGALVKTLLKSKGTIPPGGDEVIRLELAYQGCSDSLCYRLTRKELRLPVRFENGGVSQTSGKRTNPFQDQWLLISLLLAFLGGIGSAFTPCVLPLIPITLAFIGVRREGTGIGRNLLLSLFLVLPMALVYAVTGLAAALFGKGLGFLFQNVWFLLFTTLLYIAFALSLLGFFELQLPLSVRNALARLGGKGIGGAIVAGSTLGLLAAPCLGPLVGSLLLYVAERQDLVRGFALLFSYGLGLGFLFLVIGTFYHKLATKVHGGAYTVWIKRVLAVILLIPAFYYGSIALGHLKREKISEMGGVYFWNLDADRAFSRSRAEGKPLFIDFFASWCLPCLEMEAKTFSDEKVQQILVHRFIPLKIDCTQETSQCQTMVEKHSVIGWPTFLIVAPDGRVIETIVGQSLSASEMVALLQKSLTPYSSRSP